MSTSSRLLRQLAAVVLAGVALLLAALVAAGPVTAALRAVGVLSTGPPPNDAFTSAALVAGEELTGTTAGATAEPAEVTAGAAAAGDRTVWFRWTADRSGWTTVLPADGNSGQQVRVWVGERLADLRRADTPPTSAPAGTAAGGTSLPTLAGTTYAVSVVSQSGGGSPFGFSLWQPADGVPGNDEPSGAVTLDTSIARRAADRGAAGLLVTGTTGSATAAAGEAPVGGAPADRSVWYRLTGPLGGGSVTFTVQRWGPGTRVDGGMRLGLWEAAGATPSLVSGVADGPLTGTLKEGAAYLVSVDGPATWFDLLGTTSGVAPPDRTPPAVSCESPPADWTAGAVSVRCTARDTGSGLADVALATVTLTADPGKGVESDAVPTSTREVCDRAGNCAVAGPVKVKVDTRPPTVACDPVPGVWSPRDESVTCRATDAGSGLAQPEVTQRTDVPAGTTATPTLPAVQVCDRAGNCASAGPFGPMLIDKQPPAVACAAPPSGWQRDEVSVGCTAKDDGAGLAATELASFPLVTSVGAAHADGAAVTGTRSVCDLVGNCSTAGPVGPVQVDRAAPAVSCPPPSGWSAGDISLPCTSTDNGSGLAGSGNPVLTATLPAGQESASVTSSTAQVCDQVGNCTPAGPVTGLRIDRAPPALQCESAPTGWSNQPVVVVACTGRDSGSGLAGPDRVELTASVPDGQESAQVTSSTARLCDGAGNCATAGPVGPLKIDRRPPSVTCAAVPPGGSVVDVRLPCTASDAGSGLAEASSATFVLRTHVPAGRSDPAAGTDSRRVCDAAGNCTAAGPFTAAVDRSSPPPWPGPSLAVPEQVRVLAATTDGRAVPVPYTLPGGRDGRDQPLPTACTRPPGGTFPVGWSLVACGAQDDADRVASAQFPLLVQTVPELAPSGAAQAGRGWRAVGIGFAPGSAVGVELDGAQIGTASADRAGRVSRDVVVPGDAAPGQHLLVVRGRSAAGQELLVVSPFTVVAEGAGLPPGGSPGPTTGPGGSPTGGPRPTTGPTSRPGPSTGPGGAGVGGSPGPAATAGPVGRGLDSSGPGPAAGSGGAPLGAAPKLPQTGPTLPPEPPGRPVPNASSPPPAALLGPYRTGGVPWALVTALGLAGLAGVAALTGIVLRSRTRSRAVGGPDGEQ